MSAFEEGEDLTRKQRREQARLKRKELEEAEAARAVRRTRLIQLGIVGAIVVAIIVVILIATGGSEHKGLVKPGQQQTALVQEIDNLLSGIPQTGNALGSPHAPVTLQYFGDLQCPVCREFTLGALKPLIEGDVRTGKLRIEYRSMETATREPETFRTQQTAALAAGRQQRMWHYVELFYHQQGEENSGYVTESYLQKIAAQVPGLNLAKWSSDRSSGEFTNQLVSDSQAVASAGLSGTPSFLIGHTGGKLQKLEYSSLTDPSSFQSAIDSVAKA